MTRFSVFQKMWAVLTKGERRDAGILLLLMILGAGLETLGIGMVIPILAVLTSPNLSETYPFLEGLLQAIGNPEPARLTVLAMLSLVGVYLFRTGFLVFLVWRQNRFSFGIQAELSQRLFTMFLSQPYSFHLQRNSAQLIRIAVQDVNSFTFYAVIPSITLLTEILVIAGLGGLLFVVEPKGALIVMGLLTVSAGVFYRIARTFLYTWGTARLLHEGKRIQHLQQGLGGAKDVKVLGRESAFLGQYSTHNVESAKAGRFQRTLQELPRLWLELLAIVGLAVLVLALSSQGQNLLTILPTLGLFSAAAFRLMPSTNRVLGAVQAMRYGMPVVDGLYEEVQGAAVPPVEMDSQGTPFHDRLEFDEVRHTYSGAAGRSLDGVSVVIRCGETVGFIGTSGAGKSTLVDVLLGLLAPERGEIRVDGNDIHESIRHWQRQVGYVPQSVFLTDDTLRRNVAFGLPDESIDEEAVGRALKLAQLEEYVVGLPEGLDTVVGERGVRLSGGQMQRIGIARALYLDPAVLVLDEATSSLDVTTEEEVMRAVYALQGSKTIVIVSHRLSTVERCDRLYRLENGRIVESGSPADLLRNPASV